ncbi:MAG: hypothetical protein AMXMBFR53_39790 [Gemmatimonadota bacterium]
MRRLASLRPAALAAVLAVASACADRPADDAPAAAAETQAPAPAPSLATATGLGVPNAHEPLPHLLTAGQVNQAQMEALAGAGYTRFISLRLPGEDGAGWEEAFATGQGLDFQRLAISGAADLTRENVEALDRILDAAVDAPTVLYCGSANRVGAMLALRAHWLDGASAEEAMELGRAAGMTRLEPAVAQLLGVPAGTP